MTLSVIIVGAIVSLLFSVFFSSAEVAYFSSNKMRYATTDNRSNLIYRFSNLLYARPQLLLSFLVVAKVVALVVFLAFSFLLFKQWAASANFTLIHFILFGISLLAVYLLASLFLPRLVFRRRVSSIGNLNELTNEDTMDAEVKIFRNAIDFSGLKIKDCMVPRADIVAVSVDTDVEMLKEKFIETGLSRILVYDEDIDNILGYIHIWEMFSQPDDWTTCVASISVVPESMPAKQLLSDLMQNHKSIAVVVDEFGGTSGIVTMEDLVEEIFGEIEDEYDVQSSFIKQDGDNAYILSGRVEVDYLNELYHLGIPVSDDYTTVAGYLLHHTQRFPKTYETVIIGRLTFKVLKVTARKIEVVRLQVNEAAGED